MKTSEVKINVRASARAARRIWARSTSGKGFSRPVCNTGISFTNFLYRANIFGIGSVFKMLASYRASTGGKFVSQKFSSPAATTDWFGSCSKCDENFAKMYFLQKIRAEKLWGKSHVSSSIRSRQLTPLQILTPLIFGWRPSEFPSWRFHSSYLYRS